MKNLLMMIIFQAAVVGLAACSAASVMKASDIPPPLQVPTNAVLTRQAHAAGVQVYRCSPDKNDAARFEWSLKAPEADLYDHAGNRIGKHFAGPTWEAKDGSRVTGEVAARANGPDPKAIAWLLLNAKSTSGSGTFGNVRFIQRLRTVGGNAPSNGCSQASAGSEVRVPYSAEYWFYIAKP